MFPYVKKKKEVERYVRNKGEKIVICTKSTRRSLSKYTHSTKQKKGGREAIKQNVAEVKGEHSSPREQTSMTNVHEHADGAADTRHPVDKGN